MEAEKIFTIGNRGPNDQFINVTSGLGRILFHPEVDEIITNYGSRPRRSSGETYLDIVPPIPKEHLVQLGEALIHLAKSLDNSPPPPTYKIN